MENIKNELDIINNAFNTINEQLKLIVEKGVNLEINKIYSTAYLESNKAYTILKPDILIKIN